MGNLQLSPSFHLTNVLFIPGFKYNLISVSQLTKASFCLTFFTQSHCIFQDQHMGKLIGMGEECGGLYHLQAPGPIALHTDSTTKPLWHFHLGHSSLHCTPKDFSNLNKDAHCDIYIRAKNTRLPFSLVENKSASSFDRIYCDIRGGYATPSHSSAHYFLTIVDDYSRVTWVYLMKFKSNIFSCLTNFFLMIKTQFNFDIKRIRTDNGQAFLSHRMQKFFSDHGVIHERTCVETPQQNGVAERKHRHLLNVARCLRFQASLPISFWGECILTATYLINRTPSVYLHH